MQDDEFPYLADERRAHRRTVVFTFIAIALGITGAVLKYQQRRERQQEFEDVRLLNAAMEDYRAAQLDPANAPAIAPDHAPIELTLELATALESTRVDVDGKPIWLDDGRVIELVPVAEKTFVGAEFWFRYPSTLRATTGDKFVTLSSRDATAVVAVVDSDAGDADDLVELAAPYVRSGRLLSSEAARHTLLGRKVKGRRVRAGKLVVELLSVRFERGRRLRVIVTGSNPDADLEPLLTAVATIRAGVGTPAPELTAIMRNAAGEELGRVGLEIGHPAWAGDTQIGMVLERRAMVRERLAGITFEHAPALVATVPDVEFPVVQLRAGDQLIQIMAAPIAIVPEDFLDSTAKSGAVVSDKRSVARDLGGATYRGSGATMSVGAISLEMEAFTFERSGRWFVVALQYLDSPDTILRLAGPVVASIR